MRRAQQRWHGHGHGHDTTGKQAGRRTTLEIIGYSGNNENTVGGNGKRLPKPRSLRGATTYYTVSQSVTERRRDSFDARVQASADDGDEMRCHVMPCPWLVLAGPANGPTLESASALAQAQAVSRRSTVEEGSLLFFHSSESESESAEV
jgi:hypothetical protein